MSRPMKTEHSLVEQLRQFLMNRLSTTHLELSGLEPASLGLSRENWRFDVRWRDAAGRVRKDELILRRDPPASLLDTDRATEFALLEALHPLSSLPTPEPRWLDADGRWFGRPSLIMTRHPGASEPFILADGEGVDRLALARRFMDLLIEIHRVDVAGLGLDRLLGRSTPGGAAQAALNHWEARMRGVMLEPLPELEFVLAWLRAYAPQNGEEVLVHGDFKPGNLLIDAGDVVAVIDWETAHIGDPLEDLGWVVNPIGAAEFQIPGAWERSDIIAYYETRSGRPVDEAAVRWWSVLAILKLAVNRLVVQRISAAGLFQHDVYGLDAIYDLMAVGT